ncbi:efflux RND transporter periplasmic adaptor subunit [Silicimonas algicola]|uniref:RND family efflux transporter MFP subunit n=1 Tax=Silicimonas algicola TaxID=1826607 RepID=A0A316GEA7_9RHOB|nr:efflux RND transporter periplasmic adaptor subunit [Silicimonas algicola]AZQ66679.1 efflux RND transporter periplasmic adaptor subunit [Silicimonas algicola]PWK59032.1 RND family efflux transporter MFP subunit [Silicimonas algicola]
MSLLKQVLVTVVLVAVAVWGLAAYVPASHPMLDRLGLLERLGIEAEAAVATQGGGGQGRGGGGPVIVIAKAVEEASLYDEITTIGDGRALRSVAILPEVAGNLSAVNVQSGDYVNEGDILVTMDDASQQIELERARFVVEDAREALERVNALGGTVSRIQRSSATLAVQTAELDLREAQLEIERRKIVAPIAGWLGIIAHTVGDQVTPTTEIAQIDDRSEIVVEFRVPERFVAQIEPGDGIRATPLARPQLELEGRITAIDNRVDSDSRTLRLQASLANADDMLRAGMAFRITLSFTGDPFPTIDPLAIQWGSDGPFVWVIREGKAERQKIMIQQRNSDTVLVGGGLEVGEQVVTEGMQNLRPGTEVTVLGDDAALKGPAPGAVTRG